MIMKINNCIKSSLLLVLFSGCGTMAEAEVKQRPGVYSGFQRIIPMPKKISVRKGFCDLAKIKKAYTSDSTVYKTATEEIKRSAGISLPEERNVDSKTFFIMFGSEQKNIALYQNKIPNKEQGYYLLINNQEIVLAAKDRRGLMNALWSLIQIIDQDGARLTCMEIYDYPDILNRFFHIAMRGKKQYAFPDDQTTMNFHTDLLRRLARYKYTHISFAIKENMELKKNPGYWVNHWKQDDVKKFVRFGKSIGLSIFPEVKTLVKFVSKRNKKGQKKCGDLLEPKVDLRQFLSEEEKKKAKKMFAAKPTFKAKDERVYKLLFSVIDEVYEAFDNPEYVNIGMDEATYLGASTPKEDKSKLFAYAVNRLNKYIRQKGATTIMASDMLESHEQFPHYHEAHGGPPFNTHRAIDMIDKNIILWSWHYGWTVNGVTPKTYPQIEWETQKGFKVLGSPWFKRGNMVNIAKQVYKSKAFGIMGTTFGFVNAAKFSLGTLKNTKSYKKEKGRKQMGIFASTAEAAWSPEKAQEIISSYDDLAWEMQYFKKYIKKRDK
jgi:Glycosyl hydrolase family 20, domain 2/Glycosyl hydrolase family 20, catalytic domain